MGCDAATARPLECRPMRAGRSARQLIAWIACFAILMSTLAPVISQALRADPATPWTEVCTPLGAKLVRIDDATPGSPTQKLPGGHPLQHCPYCTLHAMGLPPAPASPLQLPVLSFGLPELFYAAPAPLHAWATAQPRAPPRLS